MAKETTLGGSKTYAFSTASYWQCAGDRYNATLTNSSKVYCCDKTSCNNVTLFPKYTAPPSFAAQSVPVTFASVLAALVATAINI
jgi:hypothetical protein